MVDIELVFERFSKDFFGYPEDRFSPEDQIPNNWDLGNLNIEYALIYDDAGKEVYRDQDFSDDIVPSQNRISNI